MIEEYRQLTQKADFTEEDIEERDKQIHDKFIEFGGWGRNDCSIHKNSFADLSVSKAVF